MGGAHDINIDDPAAAIAPVGEPNLLALCQASDIHVPDVKVPALQETDITKGYLLLLSRFAT